MSAWIVSKQHIDVLVAALRDHDLLPADADLDATGTLLWHENHRSVNARYRENTATPPYHFAEPVPLPETTYYTAFDPHNINHIIVQAACYDYQTCETDDYETTPAYALFSKLIATLTDKGADRNTTERIHWGV
jgi:hypothetical protein